MLIRRKIIAITVSLIMTSSIFMTQMLAAETDDVSGNDTQTAEASVEEDSGDSMPAEEPPEETNDDSAAAVDQEEAAGSDDTEDAAPAMVVVDDNAENGKESVSEGNAKPKATKEEEETKTESDEARDNGESNEGNKDDSGYEDNIEENDKESDEVDPEEEKAQEEAAEEADKSEQEWLDEHGVTRNEDGTLEYTDDNGDTWEFAPEDPEMFKRIGNDEEYDRQTPIGLKNAGRNASLGEEQDPYSLILNPDFKYRYPEYYQALGEGSLPDVRLGMDISRYQGVISPDNWKKLKDEYGVEFVFIRAGYRGYGGGGSLNVDECCTANIENAHEAGVAVGIYYFSQAISVAEAEAEADHCLEIIDGCRDMITLPVVTDYEYSGSPGRLLDASLSDAEHTAIVNAFCDRVESDGYLSGIYANKSMLQSDMVLDDIPDNHQIWMANFVCDGGAGTYSTSYYGPLCSWQFSSRFVGFGEGGSGLHLMKSVNLDLDLWYGDFPGEDRSVPEDTSFDEEEAVVVDIDTGESEIITSSENTESPDEQDQTGDSGIVFDPMSISNTVMTAEDVVYSPRPRACRSVIKICDSDGSRLAAGFDYERELVYTYDEDTVVKRRTDMWARNYEEVAVSAGDPVDMKRDVIPAGTVIRVTATGKGRYEDPENNTVSATFRIIPEKEEKEEPVEIEAVTEENTSGRHERLLARLKTGE